MMGGGPGRAARSGGARFGIHKNGSLDPPFLEERMKRQQGGAGKTTGIGDAPGTADLFAIQFGQPIDELLLLLGRFQGKVIKLFKDFGVGDTKITVFSDGKETLNSRLGFCRRELIELSISDFVRRLKNGENLYFNNASEIFYKHRKIVDDMELPRLNQTFGRTLGFSVNHIFFGRKGGGSALHCANTSNFFFNAVGRKHWVLIEPQYSRFLRPVPSKDGMFSVSKMDCFDTGEDNPLLKLPRYEITLEPGDMLFNAHWWWHGVRNLSDFSIAVANRWTNHPVHMLANNLFYSHLVLYHPSTMSSGFSLMLSNLTGRDDGSRNAAYEKNHLDALANTKGK